LKENEALRRNYANLREDPYWEDDHT